MTKSGDTASPRARFVEDEPGDGGNARSSPRIPDVAMMVAPSPWPAGDGRNSVLKSPRVPNRSVGKELSAGGHSRASPDSHSDNLPMWPSAKTDKTNCSEYFEHVLPERGEMDGGRILGGHEDVLWSDRFNGEGVDLTQVFQAIGRMEARMHDMLQAHLQHIEHLIGTGRPLPFVTHKQSLHGFDSGAHAVDHANLKLRQAMSQSQACSSVVGRSSTRPDVLAGVTPFGLDFRQMQDMDAVRESAGSSETSPAIGPSMIMKSKEWFPVGAPNPATRTPFQARGSKGSMHDLVKGLELKFKESRRKDGGEVSTSKVLVVGCANKIISHVIWEWIINLCIIINAAFIGIEADFLVRNPGASVPLYIQIVDYACTGVFSFEILLRIVAVGRRFLSIYNPGIYWNVFDSSLVAWSLLEIALRSFDFHVIDLSAARLLSLIRLLRIVRVVRVLRTFSDLRVMVLSILTSLKSLLWAVILLGFIIFLYAVSMMQFVASTVAETEPDRIYFNDMFQRDTTLNQELLDHYGSLWQAVYTLYMCLTNGLGWGQAAGPLIVVSPFFGAIFSLFVAFAQFCVLNVMTGIFVENASKMTMLDEDNMLMEELDSRKKWIQGVVRLFEEVNPAGCEYIEKGDFIAALSQVRVQSLMNKLGIDVLAHKPEHVFDMFDYDGNGEIEIQEFAAALQQLHGTARSMDLAKLKVQCKSIARDVRSLKKHIVGLHSQSMGQATIHRGPTGMTQRWHRDDDATLDHSVTTPDQSRGCQTSSLPIGG
mmetsp:Transcript_63196/g.150699  ORF Transcript_63196/g.150699 Transcript_63196/m.150699 type:complete len:765 (+) Transcript_63196:150-2444(+)